MQLIETLEEKYHNWQQKAREKYLSGYYPGHERMPNFIVRGLYWVGYFIGDFLPLILNLIDGIYQAIRRLTAFVVGLLIEASIFIVLLGSIVFSISHSIERLRIAGATGGLEYVGVLMFEVIFIGSAATLTGILMKKKKPSGLVEWLGLICTILGFLVGLGFVWWSNFNGMAQNWEGWIIGSVVPLLVLIGEVVLAYRYVSESEEGNQARLLAFIRRNGVAPEDALKAIEMYLRTQPQVQPQTVEQPTAKAVADPVENTVEVDTISGSKSGSETVENPVENLPQNRIEPVAKMVVDPVEEAVEKPTEKDDEKVKETDEKSTAKVVEEPTEKVDEKQPVEMAQSPDVSTDSADVKTTKNGTISPEEKEAIPTAETVEEPVEKAVVEAVENAVENDAVEDQETNRDLVENAVEKTTANEKEKVASTVEKPTKKTTKRTLKKDSNLKLKKSIKRWALDYFQKNGKPPGRVIIEKEFGMNQNQARLVANEIKKELGIKAS